MIRKILEKILKIKTINFTELKENLEKFKNEYDVLSVNPKGASIIIFFKKEYGKILAVISFPGINQTLVDFTLENLKKEKYQLKNFNFDGEKTYYIECNESTEKCYKIAKFLFYDTPNKYSEVKKENPKLYIKFENK